MFSKRSAATTSRRAARAVVAGCIAAGLAPAAAHAQPIVDVVPSLAGDSVAVGDSRLGPAHDRQLTRRLRTTWATSRCPSSRSSPRAAPRYLDVSCTASPGADPGTISIGDPATGASGACNANPFSRRDVRRPHRQAHVLAEHPGPAERPGGDLLVRRHVPLHRRSHADEGRQPRPRRRADEPRGLRQGDRRTGRLHGRSRLARDHDRQGHARALRPRFRARAGWRQSLRLRDAERHRSPMAASSSSSSVPAIPGAAACRSTATPTASEETGPTSRWPTSRSSPEPTAGRSPTPATRTTRPSPPPATPPPRS